MERAVVEGAKEETRHLWRHIGSHGTTILLTVLVLVRYGNLSIETYALLDKGSQVSLIREDIANDLKMRGPIKEKKFETFHEQDPRLQSRSVCFKI